MSPGLLEVGVALSIALSCSVVGTGRQACLSVVVTGKRGDGETLKSKKCKTLGSRGIRSPASADVMLVSPITATAPNQKRFIRFRVLWF